MNTVLAYIRLLKGDSFEGWSEDSKKGYLTACISIEKFIENEKFNGEKIIEKIKCIFCNKKLIRNYGKGIRPKVIYTCISCNIDFNNKCQKLILKDGLYQREVIKND